MKIDILFLNNEMNGHDEYFDNDLFQEYCETHSFEGQKESDTFSSTIIFKEVRI